MFRAPACAPHITLLSDGQLCRKALTLHYCGSVDPAIMLTEGALLTQVREGEVCGCWPPIAAQAWQL